MLSLIIGLSLLTIATSANSFFPEFKSRVIKTCGVFVWSKGIEIIVFVGILFMLANYSEAKMMSLTLWSPNIVTIYLALITNFIAIWLLVSGYISGNIVKIKVTNPVILGVAFWALAHLILDGDVLSIILFLFLAFWTIVTFKVTTSITQDNQRHSFKASASTLFLSLMLWIYIIREGYESFAAIGVVITK